MVLCYENGIPEDVVLYLLRKLILAVGYLHEKHIIHQDLKIENILL